VTTVPALAELRATPLSVVEVLAAVAHPAAGGQSLFVGTVRDHDEDRSVTSLDYSAHPTAAEVIRGIAERIGAEPEVLGLAVVHRVGSLAIGDDAIIAAVATAHRAEAFDVCRRLVDTVKHDLPVWKLQHFADGSTEWVGSC
jgi:molybdopterin synthase catalytic subunit